jgi:cysteine-rich repeat protein
LVCGDGIPETLCGEQCDDGNLVVGDGCSGPCRLERIPGGGSPATDCFAEWVVDNPANAPRFDKHGAFSGVQVCRDGEAAGDIDAVSGPGPVRGRVCANNTDRPACEPGSRLRTWELRSPSANKAAKRPDLAAVRSAFAGVAGAIVGPPLADVCSDVLAVPVAVRSSAAGVKPGSVVLKSFATLYSGEKDADKLKLICMP